MTHFNTKEFDDPRKAAEFIVQAHQNGETLTVDNTDAYSSPHMHSHHDYETAERPDGTVGVKTTDSSVIHPTPKGTVVLHSG